MLKAAVIILIVMLAYAGIYSLISIFVPTLTMKSALTATTGKTIDDARRDGYLNSLVVDQIKIGIFALATVISGFFVLFAAFRNAQKWAWYAFLVVGIIGWLNGLITAIAIGDMANLLLQIIGVVIFLVGLLIPIKVFFSKKEA